MGICNNDMCAQVVDVSEAMSNRLKNMSFLCACLVVLIHVPWAYPCGSFGWWFSEIVAKGVSRVAVPFFFFNAGFFLVGHIGEKNWWRDAVHKRIKSLLIPFYIWNLLFVLYVTAINVVKTIVRSDGVVDNISFSPIRFLKIIGIWPLSSPELGPLWFVRSLFIMVILAPVLVRLARPLCIIVAGSAFALIYPFLYDKLYHPWLEIFRMGPLSVMAFFCTLVGVWVRVRDYNFVLRRKHCYALLIIGCSMVIGYSTFLRFGIIPFGIIRLKLFAVPLLLLGMLGIMPKEVRFPAMVSCAFPLYLSHDFLIELFRLHNRGGAFCALCAITVPIGCSIIARKIVPKCCSVIWGGR